MNYRVVLKDFPRLRDSQCMKIHFAILCTGCQGDDSGSSQPPVDIKTEVSFKFEPHVLKRNLCSAVNERLGTTQRVTLYICGACLLHLLICLILQKRRLSATKLPTFIPERRKSSVVHADLKAVKLEINGTSSPNNGCRKESRSGSLPDIQVRCDIFVQG